MNSEIIVAADFGSSKIAVMAGQKNADGKIKVLGVEQDQTPVDSIRSGLIIKPSDVSYKINTLMKLLENRIQKPISKFYINLNAHSMRTCKASTTQTIESGKEIDQAILDKMLMSVKQTEISNRHILHVTPQEYQLDTEPIKDPLNSIGSQLIGNYVITIGKTEILDNIQKSVDRSGYTSEECIISPLATSMALLSDTEKELGCLLLDFGAGTTSLSIFKDGYLRHFAIIPFGGKHITSDLKDLNIREQDAEKLKVLKGAARTIDIKKSLKIQVPSNIEGIEPQVVSNKDIAIIIEARLREILNFVKEQIKKSGYADKLGAGIVITGGASQLEGLDTLSSEILEYNVRKGSCENILDKELAEYNLPEYTSLIGLMLYGKANCISSAKNEQGKKPKLPRKNIFGRVSDKMVSLFDDELPINDKK